MHYTYHVSVYVYAHSNTSSTISACGDDVILMFANPFPQSSQKPINQLDIALMFFLQLNKTWHINHSPQPNLQCDEFQLPLTLLPKDEVDIEKQIDCMYAYFLEYMMTSIMYIRM